MERNDHIEAIVLKWQMCCARTNDNRVMAASMSSEASHRFGEIAAEDLSGPLRQLV
ncbi:MAG: hypothetical protein ONB37_17240 [candidate division KSB1 bacterium]|nr:hypothetical protein [candidate division KSB1 bacterium]